MVLALYGNPQDTNPDNPFVAETPSGQGVVFQLTDTNRFAYRDALKAMVARVLGLSGPQEVLAIPIWVPELQNWALQRARRFDRVVYVGHAYSGGEGFSINPDSQTLLTPETFADVAGQNLQSGGVIDLFSCSGPSLRGRIEAELALIGLQAEVRTHSMSTDQTVQFVIKVHPPIPPGMPYRIDFNAGASGLPGMQGL